MSRSPTPTPTPTPQLPQADVLSEDTLHKAGPLPEVPTDVPPVPPPTSPPAPEFEDAESATSSGFGKPWRYITLVQRRHALDIASEATRTAVLDASAPNFEEVTLVMVPRKLDKQQLNNNYGLGPDCILYRRSRDELGLRVRGAGPNWDIALLDPSREPACRVWNMAGQCLTGPSSLVESGIVRGRISNAQDREALVQAIERSVAKFANLGASSLDWANNVVSETFGILHDRIEEPGQSVHMVNDGSNIHDLLDWDGFKFDEGGWKFFASVGYCLARRDRLGIIVDQHLAASKLKWSANAYPPCNLMLGSLPPMPEVDIPWPPTAARQLKRDSKKFRSAVLLIPRLGNISGSLSDISWTIGIVGRRRWTARVIYMEAIDKGQYALKGKRYLRDEYFYEEQMDQRKGGGILIGYSDPKDVDKVTEVLMSTTYSSLSSLLWIRNALVKTAEMKYLIAPDHKSSLPATWINGLIEYIQTALKREVGIPLPGQEDFEISAQVSQHILNRDRRYELVDERYLHLRREWRRFSITRNTDRDTF